ncbi:MAG: Calx-beta domain-containing protein, partial [Bacillota bacterium]
ALLSLQQQLQTSGLALRGGEVSFPSGFDYSAKVTAVADQSVVNNTTGTVTVTYTLSKELAHDVRFSVRTVSGSAAAGTNYTSVSAAVEIEAGDTSAQVTVDIKAAAVWNGQKTFFVEAYDIGGALFDDGSLRCSVP